MQILLVCAKTMHDEVMTNLLLTAPRFQQQAERFARDMMQYDIETIAEILTCSRQIAAQNKLRFTSFFDADKPKLPAILTYHGQAYKHLKAETLNEEDLCYANTHLWITSFLYGLLRPLDGILPYRMEGRVTLPSAGGRTLFDFWKPYLTECLIESVKADDGILIHLATEEFQHLFDWKRVCKELHVVQPLFYVRKGRELKMQAVWAKTGRGAMTRYIIRHHLTTPEELCAFSYENFQFASNAGDADFPHFIRE